MMLRNVALASAAATRAAAARRAIAPRGLSALAAMKEEYPGVPATMPAEPSPIGSKTSTLSNGAKVVTLENGQRSSAVGMVVGSGSRDESNAQKGASMVMETMAFRAAQDRTGIRLHRDVELAGGTLYAAGGRETMTYMADCPPEAAELVLDSIAATVVKPKIVQWEVEEAKEKLNAVTLRLHAECTGAQVMESLHAAAYGDVDTLGKPVYGPCALSAEALREFHGARYKAAAITVLGVNVPHEDLKSMAESALADVDTSPVPTRPASEYLAGESRVRADTPMTSVAIAFGAPGASDASAPAYEVLGTLIDLRAKIATPAAAGFASIYSDGGLVGVSGTGKSAEAGALTHALVACVKGLAAGPSAAELDAAVAAAKVARHLTMERPSDALWAMAGGASGAADLDAVTAADVKAAAAAAVRSGVTVAAVGNVGEVPLKTDIVSML